MDPNPFATRFIRPGAIDYLFDASGESLPSLRRLADRFLDLPGRRAAIVGPNGTGKSTLLASLGRHWANPTDSAVRFDIREARVMSRATLFRGDAAVRALLEKRSEWTADTLILLDGFEQLTFIERIRLRQAARASGARVLVTCHQSIRGYPTVHKTGRDPRIDAAVLGHLLAGTPYSVEQIRRSEPWQRSLREHRDNLRESLFAAFDAVVAIENSGDGRR